MVAVRKEKWRRAVRWVVLAPLAVAGAVVARSAWTRRQMVRTTLPELRSPVLLLPITPRGGAGLRVMRLLPMPTGARREGVEIASSTIEGPGGDLEVLTYRRRDARPRGALLWIHGGGFVMGRPSDGDHLCSRWADDLGLLVASVEYRLAPEHPFPAGLDDCAAALAWLHDEAERLDVDRSRIAVGGDSAGGGLAASLCQRARDDGGPAIAFALLMYPMLDDRTATPRPGSPQRLAWSRESNRFGWSSYLGRPAGSNDPTPAHAVPARTADLSGLPPAWIGVGDLDLFHEECDRFATRLRAAGVRCDLDVVRGMYHGADRIMPRAPTTIAFLDRMTSALAKGLRPFG